MATQHQALAVRASQRISQSSEGESKPAGRRSWGFSVLQVKPRRGPKKATAPNFQVQRACHSHMHVREEKFQPARPDHTLFLLQFCESQARGASHRNIIRHLFPSNFLSPEYKARPPPQGKLQSSDSQVCSPAKPCVPLAPPSLPSLAASLQRP